MKKVWLACAAALFAAGPVAGAGAARTTGPPHILFIVLDSARADHFSCYGYPKTTTPRLDELAKRGTVFLNSYSPDSHTETSVPRILSSRYISALIFPVFDFLVTGSTCQSPETIALREDPGQVFLPELLAQRGYRTAVFSDHAFINERSRLAGMFQKTFLIRNSTGSAQDIVRQASEWLHGARDERAFAYIHLLSPHEPYDPVPEEAEFLPGLRRDEAESLRARFGRRDDQKASAWSPADLSRLVGFYDAKLKHIDGQVGGLLDDVRRAGREERTLVVVTADHGENLGEHGHLTHAGLPWNSVTHVPLIIALTGGVPAGRVVKQAVASIDIAPTLLALTGVGLPPGKTFDGMDLTPLMEGKGSPRKYTMGEDFFRVDGFKIIPSIGHLSNEDEDPGETVDLSRIQPALAQELRTRHERLLQPYRLRSAQAARLEPPPYRFHYPMGVFEFSPSSAVRRTDALWRPEGPTNACWFLKGAALRRTASCRNAPPIMLSASVPTGSYHVSILFECRDSGSPIKERFEFRSDLSGGLRRCSTVKKTGMQNIFNCVFGPAHVDDGTFRVELRMKSMPRNDCGLRAIRFRPAGVEVDLPETADPGKSRELRDELKRSGYW